MANNYKRCFCHKHYSFSELSNQFAQVKKYYSDTNTIIRPRGIDGFVVLQPTENSISYKLRISTNVDSTIVSIFPIDPYIGTEKNGNIVPHMYNDGSLCLFYSPNQEWSYDDLWAESLIPWASLWLYYYEIWLQTGEWLGGGIHSGEEKKKEQ